MKHLGKIGTISLVSYTLSLVYPRVAWAYLDPGTGSYFFQILIGVVLGSLLAVRLFWGKIRIFIQRMFSSNKDHVKGE
jgi:hypothetical protein